MTTSNFLHPGEIRKATNLLCLHCNRVFIAPQGLGGHLLRVHKISPTNIQQGVDWEVTNQVADSYKYISNRIGDGKMKSKMEETHNFECLRCGAVLTSPRPN